MTPDCSFMGRSSLTPPFRPPSRGDTTPFRPPSRGDTPPSVPLQREHTVPVGEAWDRANGRFMFRILLVALLFGLVTGSAKAAAVHQGAEEGRLEMVEAALAEDPECIASPDENGYQPLHLAARNGHL